MCTYHYRQTELPRWDAMGCASDNTLHDSKYWTGTVITASSLMLCRKRYTLAMHGCHELAHATTQRSAERWRCQMSAMASTMVIFANAKATRVEPWVFGGRPLLQPPQKNTDAEVATACYPKSLDTQLGDKKQ